MNFQYRYGTTTTEAIKALYADGGCSRYYQGLSAALVQGPVARFGDTAANAGILALLESNPFMKKLRPAILTVFASLSAAGFRIILTPIDTVKTTLQTEGKPGLKLLRNRVRRYFWNSLGRGSGGLLTDQEIRGNQFVVWGAGDGCCNLRWTLPRKSSSPGLLVETDCIASGLRCTTLSKSYFQSRIPKD